MSVQIRNADSGTLERVAGFNDVDAILSPTSANPIMNKSVYNALAQKVEKTVNDLVNYYTTAQVYNKAEVRELIGAINTLTIEVVATLPTSDISPTTIYFVGPASGTNNYDEYVYVGSTWVKIGDTQIDLSDYITSTSLTTTLQSYYTKTAVDALLNNYYTTTEIGTLLDTKEDVLTFDNAPTQASNNPVKSGGVYTALAAKQDTLVYDTTPTAGSTKPVTSGGIKTALDTKEDILTFDTEPTPGSNNPVTSSGIKAYADRGWVYFNDSTVTTITSDIPAGNWVLPSSINKKLTDTPLTGTPNGCALISKSYGSDERFIIYYHPYSKKAWIKFQYGSWSGWRELPTIPQFDSGLSSVSSQPTISYNLNVNATSLGYTSGQLVDVYTFVKKIVDTFGKGWYTILFDYNYSNYIQLKVNSSSSTGLSMAGAMVTGNFTRSGYTRGNLEIVLSDRRTFKVSYYNDGTTETYGASQVTMTTV